MIPVQPTIKTPPTISRPRTIPHSKLCLQYLIYIVIFGSQEKCRDLKLANQRIYFKSKNFQFFFCNGGSPLLYYKNCCSRSKHTPKWKASLGLKVFNRNNISIKKIIFCLLKCGPYLGSPAK